MASSKPTSDLKPLSLAIADTGGQPTVNRDEAESPPPPLPPKRFSSLLHSNNNLNTGNGHGNGVKSISTSGPAVTNTNNWNNFGRNSIKYSSFGRSSSSGQLQQVTSSVRPFHVRTNSTNGSSSSSSSNSSNSTSNSDYHRARMIYLDPSKRLRTSDSELKAIQKRALLEFYLKKKKNGSSSSTSDLLSSDENVLLKTTNCTSLTQNEKQPCHLTNTTSANNNLNNKSSSISQSNLRSTSNANANNTSSNNSSNLVRNSSLLGSTRRRASDGNNSEPAVPRGSPPTFVRSVLRSSMMATSKPVATTNGQCQAYSRKVQLLVAESASGPAAVHELKPQQSQPTTTTGQVQPQVAQSPSPPPPLPPPRVSSEPRAHTSSPPLPPPPPLASSESLDEDDDEDDDPDSDLPLPPPPPIPTSSLPAACLKSGLNRSEPVLDMSAATEETDESATSLRSLPTLTVTTDSNQVRSTRFEAEDQVSSWLRNVRHSVAVSVEDSEDSVTTRSDSSGSTTSSAYFSNSSSSSLQAMAMAASAGAKQVRRGASLSSSNLFSSSNMNSSNSYIYPLRSEIAIQTSDVLGSRSLLRPNFLSSLSSSNSVIKETLTSVVTVMDRNLNEVNSNSNDSLLSELVTSDSGLNGNCLVSPNSNCSNSRLWPKHGVREASPLAGYHIAVSKPVNCSYSDFEVHSQSKGCNNGNNSPPSSLSSNSSSVITLKDQLQDSSHLPTSVSTGQQRTEVISTLSRQLEQLRSDEATLCREFEANESLGSNLMSKLRSLGLSSVEFDKISVHCDEIDKVTRLLLSLSSRLKAIEVEVGAKSTKCTNDASSPDILLLSSKRSKLLVQLEEALGLRAAIDRRSDQIAVKILSKYFRPLTSSSISANTNNSDLNEFVEFLKLKSKLIVESREVKEKISLSEKQLQSTLSGY